MRKTIIAAILILLIASAGYGVVLWASSVPVRYLDENRNGLVGVGEALRALELGLRYSDQVDCVELFWLKDGMTYRTHCTPAEP